MEREDEEGERCESDVERERERGYFRRVACTLERNALRAGLRLMNLFEYPFCSVRNLATAGSSSLVQPLKVPDMFFILLEVSGVWCLSAVDFSFYYNE